MGIIAFREDDQYKAEYVHSTTMYLGKSRQPLFIPCLLKVTRKIAVRNYKTNKVYPVGSVYYLSCQAHPRLWNDRNPYVKEQSNFAGLAYGSTGVEVIYGGISPNSYLLNPTFLRGYYYAQFIIRMNTGIDDATIKNHGYYKHGICGIAMHYSGTRQIWSGESTVYFGDGVNAEQKVGWPRTMHNWNTQTLRTGGVPLYMTDWQRWSYFRVISSMNIGGKEGGSCGCLVWTTQYWDEDDFYSMGIRIK